MIVDWRENICPSYEPRFLVNMLYIYKNLGHYFYALGRNPCRMLKFMQSAKMDPCISMDQFRIRIRMQVVLMLRNEMAKWIDAGCEHNLEYQQALVRAIRQLVGKFPGAAGSVVHLLGNVLEGDDALSALEVAFLLRETAETHAELRDCVLQVIIVSLEPSGEKSACTIHGDFDS